MPINGMNVGVDYSFSYYESTSGGLVTLGDIQSVAITQQKHDIKSQPYNQVPRFGYVPDGFKIMFNIVRTSAALEILMFSIAQAFNNGQIITPGFFNESTNNPDGTVIRWQYTNFVAFLTDHGDVSREKVVTLKMEGWASDKIRIA